LNRNSSIRESGHNPSTSNIKKSADLAKRNSSGDVSSDINYYALMASVCQLKNENAEALKYAFLAEEMICDKSFEPTTFFTFPALFVRLAY